MADFTIVKGDTIAIAGTATFDNGEDMTGWSAVVKLRKQPTPSDLGDTVIDLAFSWLNQATGDWSAESIPGDTDNLPIGIYLLYTTFIDSASRRFTPQPFQVMVTA